MSSANTYQVIFIDSAVDNYQDLVKGADPNAEVVILDANRSGIQQITEVLAAQQNIEAIHIVSHGNEASLQLGSDLLTGANLEHFTDQIQQWGNALTESGDLLLYGCDVAAGSIGEAFVNKLSTLTGADIAASNDLTGNAALGGDWLLEMATGSIEAPLAFQLAVMEAYEAVLAAVRSGFTTIGTLPANDDDSSTAIPLGFNIDYFGSNYSSVYVNNNGNITFDGPVSTYTPGALNTASEKIIAAFWADVDTAGSGSGLVNYGTGTVDGRSAFAATWPGVGYFDDAVDKLNNFQIVIIDRSDVAAGAFDFELNYNQIQWETGDASGGSGGLGGSSARAGYTNGSTVNFELPGSALNGALLDSGANALISSSLNSTEPGRYLFQVRTGNVLQIPQVLDIKLDDSNPTNASTVNYTVNFSEAVTGVDTTDFQIASGSIASAAITAVTPVNSSTYTVTVNTGTGSGTIGLNLVDNDSITSTTTSTPLGNTGTGNGNFTGPLYTLERTAPTATITPVAPDPRNSAVGSLNITFSEAVSNFDVADLSLTRDGTAVSLAGATLTTTDNITWTLNNLTGVTNADGAYQLTLNVSNITDSVGNALAAAVSESWSADVTAPTVTINQATGQADPTAGSSINFTVVFSEAVTGFDNTDIVLGGTAGATTATVTTTDNITYDVAVSGMTANGTVTASVNAGAAADAIGNTSTASTSTDNTVTYDATVPTIDSIDLADPDPTNSATVNYTVTFSQDVTGLDETDFQLAAGSIADAAITSVTQVNGSTYTVSVSTGTGDGTIGLNFVDNDSVVNPLIVPVGGTGVNNGNVTGPIYTVDRTDPTVTITPVAPDPTNSAVSNITVTFSEAVSNFDITDLTLTLDGTAVSLTGAILTTTDNITWTLGNIVGITSTDGAYQLTLNVSDITDSANNALAANGSESWSADLTAPTVTIEQAAGQADPTTGSTVNFTVVFSESVTGFDETDITLGGTAGATTATVTGSGTTYTVAVTRYDN